MPCGMIDLMEVRNNTYIDIRRASPGDLLEYTGLPVKFGRVMNLSFLHYVKINAGDRYLFMSLEPTDPSEVPGHVPFCVYLLTNSRILAVGITKHELAMPASSRMWRLL